MRPDIYASVNAGHLRQLKVAGLMRNYEIYMHNELQVMVAKGNPKAIAGIDDLVRDGVRTSLPNPVNEGIMQFYARGVLERHGIWSKIANGQECVSCQTTERNWFTAVHHRETPERIRDDKSDAGIVWKTEVMEALRQGAAIEGVELPASTACVTRCRMPSAHWRTPRTARMRSTISRSLQPRPRRTPMPASGSSRRNRTNSRSSRSIEFGRSGLRATRERVVPSPCIDLTQALVAATSRHWLGRSRWIHAGPRNLVLFVTAIDRREAQGHP